MLLGLDVHEAMLADSLAGVGGDDYAMLAFRITWGMDEVDYRFTGLAWQWLRR